MGWGPNNGADAFPYQPTQWQDSDNDGFGDNLDGYQGDFCAYNSGGSYNDRYGCLDSDGDGCFDVTEAGFVDNDFYFTAYDTIYENIMWYPSNWNTSNNPGNSSNNEHHAHLNSQGYNDIYESWGVYHVIEFSEIIEGNISGYGSRNVYNGHTYYRSNSGMGWNAAKASADAIPGAYLVVISSEEEWKTLNNRYGYNFWIGLYQDLSLIHI